MPIRLDHEHTHSPTRTRSLNCIPETQLKCAVIIECVGVHETDESTVGENYTHTHAPHKRVREICMDSIVTYYIHTYQCNEFIDQTGLIIYRYTEDSGRPVVIRKTKPLICLKTHRTLFVCFKNRLLIRRVTLDVERYEISLVFNLYTLCFFCIWCFHISHGDDR